MGVGVRLRDCWPGGGGRKKQGQATWRHSPPVAPERNADGWKRRRCVGPGPRDRKGTEERQATLAWECQSQSRAKQAKAELEVSEVLLGKDL